MKRFKGDPFKRILYYEFDENKPNEFGIKVLKDGRRLLSYYYTYNNILKCVEAGSFTEIIEKNPEKEYIITNSDLYL